MQRREFLKLSAAAVTGVAVGGCAHTRYDDAAIAASAPAERIIDIHQHADYGGRDDAGLFAHQKRMGVTHSVLLPAGRWFGLEARVDPPPHAFRLVQEHPERFSFFSNEVPYVSDVRTQIEQYLKRGALGIGEQKFEIDCDSKWFQRIAALAEEYNVPVLMHFQHQKYNTGIDRFHKVLEKYPRVKFIGHAQTWWANIDKNARQEVLYPKGPVTAGGITDRLLSDYPNMFSDTSAGSGLNAFTRDPDHMRAYLERHQDKMMFGSDCDDREGQGSKCQGAQILEQIRRLAPSETVRRKILYDNAVRVIFKGRQPGAARA